MGVLAGTVVAADHPRIIVKESDYAELRPRAAKSPWKEMKADAISYINSHTYQYDPGNQGDRYIRDRYSSMAGIMSAGALAYIVDPGNKTSYKNKMVDALSDWGQLFVDARDWRGYNGAYWIACDWSGAYLYSVLALDIIHNDLTAAERADLEAKLDAVGDWHYYNSGGGYRDSCYCVWALYQDDQPRIDSGKSSWRNRLIGEISPQGLYHNGVGYAGTTLGRVTELPFCYILSAAGEGDYFNEPRFARFVEWFYSAARTPFRGGLTFGNEKFDRHSNCQYLCTYGASRFSAEAGGNAAWNLDGRVPPGEILSYVFADWPPAEPVKPLSRIWSDGYAAFWEDSPSDRSLMGVLWSGKYTRTATRSHSHKEINAIHLCAYGEHVLRNTGYVWIEMPDGPPAVLGNTVLIDGVDHVSKRGGGMLEGFTAPRFDYARGYSEGALPNGKHWRNFVFVHPQDGRNGYWVLFDEVDANSSTSNVNVALHPNADNSTTVSDKLEYQAKIGPNTHSGHDVYLSIFLGTAPTSATIEEGFLDGEPDDFMGKYLYSTYETDGEGKRNIVTVLFPHDADHVKADMSRLSGTGYTGAEVDLGSSIVDIALESSGTSTVAHNGISFRGQATLYRQSSGNLSFYFIRGGRLFDDGVSPRRGFSSNSDVSVYVKEIEGKIISPGAEVTFYYPDITDVLLDGETSTVLETGTGWVKVSVPSGTYDLEFVTGVEVQGARKRGKGWKK